MPVEIRELMIKTTITSNDDSKNNKLDLKSLNTLRQQVVKDCLKALRNKPNYDNFNR